MPSLPPRSFGLGWGQIRMPLCGDTMLQGTLGPGGQEGHREAPISCFVLDQLGDQTQQMIPVCGIARGYMMAAPSRSLGSVGGET